MLMNLKNANNKVVPRRPCLISLMWILGLGLNLVILVGCGSSWQIRTQDGQQYLLEDLKLNTSSHKHDQLILREGATEKTLGLNNLKRILIDHQRVQQFDGRTWVALRVDFEEGTSWNAPDSGLVGTQELYILRNSTIQGDFEGNTLQVPISELSELIMEEESFLSAPAESESDSADPAAPVEEGE